MNLVPAKVQNSRRLSIIFVLRQLGFEKRCRWEEASAKLKQLLVRARRNNDFAQVAILTNYKAYLKNHLYRTCQKCGAAIKPNAIHCTIDALSDVHSPGYAKGR